MSPFPRLMRWAIALITTFFVVMMFAPLVQEIARRAGVTGQGYLP